MNESLQMVLSVYMALVIMLAKSGVEVSDSCSALVSPFHAETT